MAQDLTGKQHHIGIAISQDTLGFLGSGNEADGTDEEVGNVFFNVRSKVHL